MTRIRPRCSTVLALILGFAVAVSGAAQVREPAFAAVSTGSPGAYHYVVGERLSYQLEYESASTSDFNVLLGPGQSSQKKPPQPVPGLANAFSTAVRGTLTITVVQQDGGTWVLAYRLLNPLVTLVANGQPAAEAEGLQRELASDVFAVVASPGRVQSVRLAPGLSNLAQGFARTLIAQAQFVIPGTAPESAWRTREEDPSGEYQADYAPLPARNKPAAPGVRAFRKTKLRYIAEPAKSRGGRIVLRPSFLPHGSLTALFDFARGRLVSVHGNESQDIFVNRKKVGHVDNHVRLAFLHEDSLPAEELATVQNAYAERAKASPAVALSARPSEEEAKATIQRKALGADTFDTLSAELKKAEAAADPNYDTTPLYLKFKSLVYLHPQTSQQLAELLRAAPSDSLTMHMLSQVLSVIGNPDSQAALVSVVRSRWDDERALLLLVPTLAMLSEPTPLTEETLRELANRSLFPKIASRAQLALGAEARALMQVAPGRAQRIVNELVRQLESSSSPQTARLLLLALGNAGSPEALPVLMRFSADPAPEVRGAALSALRFIEGGQAEGRLIQALNSDPDANARLQAATALSFRKMTPAAFQAQKAAFANEKEVLVRMQILQNLWKSRAALPAVRRLVQDAAANDASKEVRKLARQLLARK